MKEQILTLSIVGIFIIAILAFLGLMPKNFNLGMNATGDVAIEDLKHIATTTGSYFATAPVKLVDIDYGREYMVISNTDATNNVYIYATTTELGYSITGTILLDPIANATTTFSGTGNLATSTIASPLSGILIAPKTSFEFDSDNLVVGELWASSTGATGLQINVNYK